VEVLDWRDMISPKFTPKPAVADVFVMAGVDAQIRLDTKPAHERKPDNAIESFGRGQTAPATRRFFQRTKFRLMEGDP